MKYKEPLLLFRSDGTRLQQRERARRARSSRSAFPARGLAVGDFDNDGARRRARRQQRRGARCCCATARATGHHWVGLRLEGTTCNRDAIGARLTWSVGGVKRSRLKTAGGSYLSSHDPREVIGLGRRGEARLAGDQVARAQHARGAHRRTCPSTATCASSRARGSSDRRAVLRLSSRRRALVLVAAACAGAAPGPGAGALSRTGRGDHGRRGRARPRRAARPRPDPGGLRPVRGRPPAGDHGLRGARAGRDGGRRARVAAAPTPAMPPSCPKAAACSRW